VGFAKRLIEAALARGGPGHVGRGLCAGRTLVLAYHNLVPDPGEAGGDRSLHLTQERFSNQIALLSRTHRFVSLDEAVTSAAGGRRPQVAITFDDAYAGAVQFGVEVLAAQGVPAVIFVAPGRLGGQAFWWDAVAGPDGPGPSPAFRAHVLGALAGRDELARGAAVSFGLRAMPVPRWARTATEQDLAAALARHPGLTLGSHTWSHPNLVALDGDALRKELELPLDWLRGRFDRVSESIAYPYGLRSAAVDAAAAAAGYRFGLSIEGGWLPRSASNRLSLPRLNVPSGVSRDGFIARAAGLLH
jgi:peptidoglycan/xylan/chitin deacetylase (PgdA/CDA1 family)